MVFTTTLLVVLIAVSTMAFFVRLPQPLTIYTQRIRPEWLAISQLLIVFAWQLMHLRHEEYNVDESTWIADALAVGKADDFWATLLTHTTSRPITVLPLLVLDKLHVPLDFYSVKVVAMVCILSSLALLYLALRNLTNARFALLLLLPLVAFYLTVQFDDFLAYNSEFICTTFIASGIWLFSLITTKRDRNWQIVVAGLLLGLIPFAKFQAIPGALVVVGFCLYEWIRQQRVRPLLLFIGAGLMPLIGAVGYCLLTGQIEVLIRHYWLYYVYYSYQYSPIPLADRFAPRNVLYYYRKQYTFAAYWFGLVLLVAASRWLLRRTAMRWTSAVLMALLLWAISIYETIQSGTGYEHYLNLVLVPHTLLAALLIYPLLSDYAHRPRLIYYGFGLVAIAISFFSRVKAFNRGYETPLPYDPAIVAFIKKQCRPTDRVAIWGWADRYYVLSGIAPATRYANSVFQMKVNAQQDYYLNQYVLDLQQKKPVLFLDAVADRQFTYDDRARYGHEHFPPINQFVNANYRLIYEQNGLRAYRLKNK